MLNQNAVYDSKGESFPLVFNLQDVTHTIEVEINNEHEISTDSPTASYSSPQAAFSAVLSVLCSCAIRFSAYRNIVGLSRDERVRSVCYVRNSNQKGAFARH